MFLYAGIDLTKQLKRFHDWSDWLILAKTKLMLDITLVQTLSVVQDYQEKYRPFIKGNQNYLIEGNTSCTTNGLL